MKSVLFALGIIVISVFTACSTSPASSGGGGGSSSSAGFTAVVAYTNNFDVSTGSFYLSKGGALAGDNTIVSNAGHACLEVHANAVNANGATGVEVQWNLFQQTDMRGENFTIDFDVYVPDVTYTNGGGFTGVNGIQWAFYDTILHSYVPVYSVLYQTV